MFQGLKKEWKAFKASQPGKRFQERYEKSQEERKDQPWYARFAKPLIALVLIAGGIVLCFIPGPGIPLLVIGAGLFADYSLVLAKGLDWTEVRLRKFFKWAKAWWKHASLLAREGVVAAGVLVAAALGYGGYRFLIH